MPRNIELKARIRSLDAARDAARRVATSPREILNQRDTYFQASRGRLKLREIDGGPAELIAYQRADCQQPRASDYHRVPVINPDLLKTALAAALGVRAVVEKTRDVFLHHSVRIHLDCVQGLGEFLEFEAVLDADIDEAAGLAHLAYLRNQFGVEDRDLVAASYVDLIVHPDYQANGR